MDVALLYGDEEVPVQGLLGGHQDPVTRACRKQHVIL
jgi:hypothetical protein